MCIPEGNCVVVLIGPAKGLKLGDRAALLARRGELESQPQLPSPSRVPFPVLSIVGAPRKLGDAADF